MSVFWCGFLIGYLGGIVSIVILKAFADFEEYIDTVRFRKLYAKWKKRAEEKDGADDV